MEKPPGVYALMQVYGQANAPYTPKEHAELIARQGLAYKLELLALLAKDIAQEEGLTENRLALGNASHIYRAAQEWYRLGRQDTGQHQQEMDLREE